jgi:putative copper export protein
MALISVWLHLLGMVVWVGGLVYQSQVLFPAARRTGERRVLLDLARRGRGVVWTAASVVVLTGLYNVTRLGPLDRVLESGAGILLAGKFILVLLMVSLAAHRDFGRLPRLQGEDDPTASLAVVAWLDRAVLLLAAVVAYLGLAVARLGH